MVVREIYVIEGLYRGIVREKRDEAEISRELTLQSRALAGAGLVSVKHRVARLELRRRVQTPRMQRRELVEEEFSGFCKTPDSMT
jgi:hypothetical protein